MILSNSASVGTPCVLKVRGCIHDGFLAFLDLDGRIDRDFLYATFLMEKARLSALAPAGTQANLNTGIVKSFEIMIPPLALQKKFVASLQRLEEVTTGQSRAHEQVDSLWRAMLARALAGELTASWREVHMKELLPEMREQTKLLAGVSPAVSDAG